MPVVALKIVVKMIYIYIYIYIYHLNAFLAEITCSLPCEKIGDSNVQ